MHESVEVVLYQLVLQYLFPDNKLLRTGDVVEAAKLLKNIDLILRIVSLEIICKDKSLQPKVSQIMNSLRAAALKSRPCVQALLLESSSGRVRKNHAEMIKCAMAASAEFRSLLERATSYASPNLIEIYSVRAR